MRESDHASSLDTVARVATSVARTQEKAAAPRRVPKWLSEVLLVGLIYLAYEASRGLDTGSAARAVHNGFRFLTWESDVHMDPEHVLTQALIRVAPLAVAAAYLYSTMHYVITPIVLVWMYRAHPRDYVAARTSLALGTVIGLIGFVVVPTAPPLLLPGAGIPDALYDFRQRGWWGGEGSVPSIVPKGFTNQFAAMPSLHVGWALWCGVLLWRHASHTWVRWLGALYPVVIALVVLSTGNHHLLDVLGGVLAMALGVGATRALHVSARTWRARRARARHPRLTSSHRRSRRQPDG